ncbi:MAG: hypothetical protein FJY83_07930 [Candidatus Aminicenantes bacterium]|nr:hypothetical protein [Candidatus Aminicenantes bacterium]
MIDLHCHILPGLDDGAQSLAEAVAMARAAEEDGIRTVVGTPHLFRGGIGLEDLEEIARIREELGRALKREGIRVEVLTGAEVRFSHNLLEEIRKHRKRLVLHTSSYLFVEFPFDYVFPGVKDVFFELMSEGLVPIIAHPERNSVFMSRPAQLYELVEMGCFGQANAGSFTGLYGQAVHDAALKMLGWGLIHILASDAHNPVSRPPRLTPALRAVEPLLGPERTRALVEDNPRAVLEDKALPFQPEAFNPEAREKSLRIKLPSFLKRKEKASS